MWRWCQAGCFLVFVAGSAVAAASLTPRTESLLAAGTGEVRIVCFGDSITGVYYHTGGLRAWPELLELALRQEYPQATIKVFNAGVSGNSLTSALARMQRDVLDRRPHLVVAMFGMNDLCYGTVDAAKDAAQRQLYTENLGKLVAQCRQAAAEVLLMTPNSVYPEAAPPRPLDRLAAFAGLMRDAGAALNVPVVDAYAEYERIHQADVRQWRQMMSETVHPAQPGHRVIAELVASAVRGRPVVLAGLEPSRPCLRHTSAALRAGAPVKVVVADVVQDAVLAALRDAAPGVEVVPIVWPVKGQSLEDIAAWTSRIRAQAGLALVVGSFSPESVVCGASEEAFVRRAADVPSYALAFASREWDVVFVSPAVYTPELSPGQRAGAALVQGMVEGHDVVWIQPASGKTATANDLLRDWFRRELEASR
jgi:acyl-CoA thioesterase I